MGQTQRFFVLVHLYSDCSPYKSIGFAVSHPLDDEMILLFSYDYYDCYDVMIDRLFDFVVCNFFHLLSAISLAIKTKPELIFCSP
ncbi:hypothetical protein Y1Q_0014408 [Alligator mississippiensis]|uniref:Uncharacterized protein n=1 Tax=Alligator mississippiensis TaxID=8496 RepID=A0A151PCN5_ALLMI|nr:hypothetical protein Y1Q_0014408 [Alligator mississippiensis]